MDENSRLTDEQKQKEEQELVKPVLNISKNKI
jgi:hypothetical protein